MGRTTEWLGRGGQYNGLEITHRRPVGPWTGPIDHESHQWTQQVRHSLSGQVGQAYNLYHGTSHLVCAFRLQEQCWRFSFPESFENHRFPFVRTSSSPRAPNLRGQLLRIFLSLLMQNCQRHQESPNSRVLWSITIHLLHPPWVVIGDCDRPLVILTLRPEDTWLTLSHLVSLADSRALFVELSPEGSLLSLSLSLTLSLSHSLSLSLSLS